METMNPRVRTRLQPMKAPMTHEKVIKTCPLFLYNSQNRVHLCSMNLWLLNYFSLRIIIAKYGFSFNEHTLSKDPRNSLKKKIKASFSAYMIGLATQITFSAYMICLVTQIKGEWRKTVTIESLNLKILSLSGSNCFSPVCETRIRHVLLTYLIFAVVSLLYCTGGS